VTSYPGAGLFAALIRRAGFGHPAVHLGLDAGLAVAPRPTRWIASIFEMLAMTLNSLGVQPDPPPPVSSAWMTAHR
jgi:hypothetical protein